jgi:predicted Rossmann fold flavoprotein
MKTALNKNIIVIGAGASGLMAAGRASECGASVLLLEKMERPGLKLLISGKGRCNLTNGGPIEEFFENFKRGGAFLRHAFHEFSNEDLRRFFESRGLALKTERGGRIFPESDRASSVLEALLEYHPGKGSGIRYGSRVQAVESSGGKVSGVLLSDGRSIPAAAVILATGGLSYPSTGSSGDGYAMARKLGHAVTPLKPALVPLTTKEFPVKEIQGLSLRNVRATLLADGRAREREFGEMLFTHFGVSGPIILTLSGEAAQYLEKKKEVVLSIDLKPALDEEKLSARLVRDREAYGRRSFGNYLDELLPKKMAGIFPSLLDIPPGKKVNQLSRAETAKLISLLKDFRLKISGTRPVEEAIVTRGGIDLREVNPGTMESRLLPKLYFCGEILDLDAKTGGYNLQAAFSTGYLAGQSAAGNNPHPKP